jgi:hypothetical protein
MDLVKTQDWLEFASSRQNKVSDYKIFQIAWFFAVHKRTPNPRSIDVLERSGAYMDRVSGFVSKGIPA